MCEVILHNAENKHGEKTDNGHLRHYPQNQNRQPWKTNNMRNSVCGVHSSAER